MPRKLSYNIDYDDIWDEEGGYGDDDYYEEEEEESHSKSYDQLAGRWKFALHS